MRLLIFHPALAPYRLDLFNALAKKTHLHIVFTDKFPTYQKYTDSLYEGLNASCVVSKRQWTIFGRKIPCEVREVIKRYKPDVIVTHEYSPVSIAVGVWRRIFPVSWKHVIWTADNKSIASNTHLMREWGKRILLWLIDGLIVYTKDVEEIYRKKYKFSGSIGISPNVQDEEAIREKVEQTRYTAVTTVKKFNLMGRKVILYIGRLASVKRVDLLLEYFAKLSDQSAVLVVVGEGEAKMDLVMLSQSLGLGDRVLFCGHQEGNELFQWYLIAPLLVLASECEPFGAVVNEALASGLSVMCSENAGASNLIIEGINGIVFNPFNIESAIKRMNNLVALQEPLAQAWLERTVKPIAKKEFPDAVKGFIDALV